MSGKAATIDIGVWLRDHGLGQYEATFRQYEIEVDILTELTEPDLEKLGLPLGHRKRLLKAIANLEASKKSAGLPSSCRLRMPLAHRYRTAHICSCSDSRGECALESQAGPGGLPRLGPF
jgi:SAM (Sterile alpha motif) domain-containing protein